jgi:hypothetical protein
VAVWGRGRRAGGCGRGRGSPRFPWPEPATDQAFAESLEIWRVQVESLPGGLSRSTTVRAARTPWPGSSRGDGIYRRDAVAGEDSPSGDTPLRPRWCSGDASRGHPPLSASGPYHHFPNKQALQAEVFVRALADYQAGFVDVRQGSEDAASGVLTGRSAIIRVGSRPSATLQRFCARAPERPPRR